MNSKDFDQLIFNECHTCKDINNIILDYKNQLKYTSNYNKVVKQIELISNSFKEKPLINSFDDIITDILYYNIESIGFDEKYERIIKNDHFKIYINDFMINNYCNVETINIGDNIIYDTDDRLQHSNDFRRINILLMRYLRHFLFKSNYSELFPSFISKFPNWKNYNIDGVGYISNNKYLNLMIKLSDKYLLRKNIIIVRTKWTHAFRYVSGLMGHINNVYSSLGIRIDSNARQNSIYRTKLNNIND